MGIARGKYLNSHIDKLKAVACLAMLKRQTIPHGILQEEQLPLLNGSSVMVKQKAVEYTI